MHVDPEALGSAIEEKRLPILKIAGGSQGRSAPLERSIIDREGHGRAGEGVDDNQAGVIIHDVVDDENLAQNGDRVNALAVSIL